MLLIKTLSCALLAAVPTTAKYVFRDEQAHTFFPREVTNTTNCNWTESRVEIAEAMAGWMAIWAGNHSDALVNRIMTPDIQLHTDRLPSGVDENATSIVTDVWNTKQMLEYMSRSGTGFTKYDFVGHFRFANPDKTKYIIRWGLEAIVGADNPSKILKEGDFLTMNGTDIYIFDECSGRISQLLTAQDTLYYIYEWGISIIHPIHYGRYFGY